MPVLHIENSFLPCYLHEFFFFRPDSPRLALTFTNACCEGCMSAATAMQIAGSCKPFVYSAGTIFSLIKHFKHDYLLKKFRNNLRKCLGPGAITMFRLTRRSPISKEDHARLISRTCAWLASMAYWSDVTGWLKVPGVNPAAAWVT